MADLRPGALGAGLQIHYIPGCGHWVQNETPAEVNERLLAFLQHPA